MKTEVDLNEQVRNQAARQVSVAKEPEPFSNPVHHRSAGMFDVERAITSAIQLIDAMPNNWRLVQINNWLWRAREGVRHFTLSKPSPEPPPVRKWGFFPGDVVQLKTGGPLMVAESIAEESKGGHLICNYFDCAGQFQVKVLLPVVLKLIRRRES